MENDKEGQPEAAAERQADLRGQREARGRIREDHLAAGRQRAVDEGASRSGSEPDNDDVSELSENDSSGG